MMAGMSRTARQGNACFCVIGCGREVAMSRRHQLEYEDFGEAASQWRELATVSLIGMCLLSLSKIQNTKPERQQWSLPSAHAGVPRKQRSQRLQIVVASRCSHRNNIGLQRMEAMRAVDASPYRRDLTHPYLTFRHRVSLRG